MTMIGVADENEAEEDRPSTTPPSPSPPAPPPPIAPPASPLRAPASPPPVLPISMDDDAPGWRQDKVGLRLPANTRRSIRGPPATSSPTISTCAATSATFHLQLLSPAADTGGYVTAQDGDATLYLLDANQGKRCDGFRAGDESRARPTHAVFSPSSSDSDDGSTASDVSSASEDGYLDGASGPGMQLPVNVFRQWAAKEDPHLLQYLQTTDADAYLALEEGEETRLALVDGIEAKGGHILQLTACKDDQQVVEQQDDVETLRTLVKNDEWIDACDDDLRAARDDELSAARDDELSTARDDLEVVEQQDGIHPMDETTCAQDQAKESIKINITETKGGHILQLTACKDDQQVVEQQDDVETLSTVVKNDDLRAACDDDLRASRDDELSAARDDEEVVEQQAGIHPMDETTCAQDQAKESIKINITETLDVEVISRKQVKSTNICGKMAVKFPPPPDVEHSMLFMVSKWSEINYTAFPRVDRELFKKIPVLSSERFPDFFELLKWRRKNGHLPLPLAVTAEAIEDPHTKEYVKGVSKYFVVISCLPTGLTDIRDVVVTIPFPSVDHIGIERKTRKHIWKSVGTHEELENSIEWKIPYIGASDKSAHMDVDAFCNDGWQEPWQFFPISIDFSYDQSIGSKVSQVVRSEDGLAVDFRQDTVARCSYTIHHPNELARRAAEAAEELLAWQLAPWAPWEDEGVEDDFVWEDEGVEDDFV